MKATEFFAGVWKLFSLGLVMNCVLYLLCDWRLIERKANCLFSACQTGVWKLPLVSWTLLNLNSNWLVSCRHLIIVCLFAVALGIFQRRLPANASWFWITLRLLSGLRWLLWSHLCWSLAWRRNDYYSNCIIVKTFLFYIFIYVKKNCSFILGSMGDVAYDRYKQQKWTDKFRDSSSTEPQICSGDRFVVI